MKMFIQCPACNREIGVPGQTAPVNCGWCMSVLSYNFEKQEWKVDIEGPWERVQAAREGVPQPIGQPVFRNQQERNQAEAEQQQRELAVTTETVSLPENAVPAETYLEEVAQDAEMDAAEAETEVTVDLHDGLKVSELAKQLGVKSGVVVNAGKVAGIKLIAASKLTVKQATAVLNVLSPVE